MTASARAALLDDLRRADDRLLEVCTSLVRVPSANPPGDTCAIAAHLDAALKPLGAEVRVVAGQPTMPNVVAVTRGRRPGRRLVFNGHLDTFVVGDRALWSVDPRASTWTGSPPPSATASR